MTSGTLILGLGNPILGDDGVGWKVAEAVQVLTARREPAVEIDFAALGGLTLMERILGYSHVILIDCLETGTDPVGTVKTLSLAELSNPNAGHSASAHDTSLLTALETARTMGASVPSRVEVVTIEARMTYEFSEQLSPDVAAAIPLAAQHVLALLDPPARPGAAA